MASKRVLPFNLDAEASLLGSMMLNRQAIEVAFDTVLPEDFHKPAHARLYETLENLAKVGASCDPVTVAADLQRRDLLDSLGGRPKIEQLIADTPASANALHYATIVAELASYRRLIAAASTIADLGYDGGQEVQLADAIARARMAIDRAELPLGGQPSPDVGAFVEEDYEYVWAIPGLLEVMDRLLIVAPEKFGKSTLIRQIAVTISQGRDPFRFHRIPPCNVMLCDLENPAPLIRRKLRPMLDRCVNTLDHQMEPERLRICSKPEGVNLGARVDEHWLLEQIAANVREWKATGWEESPFVLCIGPIYKMLDDELDLRQVRALQNVLERIRVRFRCAIIMETHAPHESFNAKAQPRSLRPAGPRVWVRWPEFCRAIEPAAIGGEGLADFYDCQGARDERDWPYRLRRGGPGSWPWVNDGDL